jgi:uncharacterized protein YndB with AHSA1/START domain
MGKQVSVSATVTASPAPVFDLITDIPSLPQWNAAITDVVEVPVRLEVGSEWKVRLHALGQTWVSKSQVSAIDPATGRFAYRSQSDDGNPSLADWEWRIDADGDASIVVLTVDLNPTTFWRKHLLVRIRRPVLRKEMRASLASLDVALRG